MVKLVADSGLQIITLGNFDLRNGNGSLLEPKHNRSYKIMDLLKLFITYKDKNMIADAIAEKLYPENELLDPRNTLRTQVYRLRKMLAEMGIMDDPDDDRYCQLNFQNGYYVFSLNGNCNLDVDLFEKYIQNGNTFKDQEPDQAMDWYRKALTLYKGEYLPDNMYTEWVIPTRNRYHRLYFRALLQQLDLLKKDNLVQEIIETCEEAFQIDPYEEAVQEYYLESLLMLGQIKQAASHYKYITTKLNQELGIKPSPVLREIYQEIKRKAIQKNDMNFLDIIRDLQEDEAVESAFDCDMEEFRAIYNLEKRKSLRDPGTSFIGFVSAPAEISQWEPRELKSCMQKVKGILLSSLRRGDVVTQWSERTVVFIVTDTSPESLPFISRRIENHFDREITIKNDVPLRIDFKQIDDSQALL
ncbi:MAG: hypothetical protein GXY50_02825 [Syntrophomonadaceae bacterium]|nr:hypothetical protein [Syntrophomonadaceae bacterium]